jgi:DNA-binding response OmpR family regulator
MTLSIIALEKDLFFSVKIRDTLRHHDMDATIVRTLPAFEQLIAGTQQPALVIINTASRGVDWEAAIRSARAKGIPVLAFGSHMDLEARTKALQAGAQKVVANSKFASDMAGLVTRTINGEARVTASGADEDETEESV